MGIRGIALILLSVLVGVLVGVGGFTFYYAEGFSYFSNKPETCVNCHAMNDEFNSWARSGHHHVAVCNDCHLPQSLIPKFIAKGRNGYNHSTAFTLENYHQPIQITKYNAEILQANCVRCHSTLVHDAILVPSGGAEQAQLCVHCHRNVGHAPVH
ncbi:MAG TPA: cytochrome c nitrite reductase small subunit [Planctomycetota bacterium]